MPFDDKLRVLVLFGGRSAEHEISLLSARFIVSSLDPARYEPLLVGVSKRGRWHLQEEAALRSGPSDPRAVHVDESLPEVTLAPVPAERAGERSRALLRVAGGATQAVDLVFPILHGPLGEDGTLQGLLELVGLPYVGAGVLGSALGMDKDAQKRLLAQAELPVLPFVALRAAAWEAEPEASLARCEQLGYPLFVKPANMGSSVGVRRARARPELAAAIVHALQFDTKLVVERGLEMPREIECSVLGNDEPEVSVPGEIVVEHPDGFYSYDAKYLDERGARLEIPAALDATAQVAVRLLAARAFRALECAGMARVDLFLSADGVLYVNELNTIPGFTAISMYPRLWAASGLDAVPLVTRLIDLGLERHRRRARLRTSV
ncbi:MAG: D-alanine--D-alanine ligase [Deltaproteobacteria bacterium]|nr:D-alanine--D-alanine ligase [Deltaproteobacteria bacterium]